MSGWNPWKMTAIGMVLVTATALVTGLVVANWNTADKPSGAQSMDALASPPSAPSPAAALRTGPPPVATAPPAAPAPARPAGAGRVASNQALRGPAPTALDVDTCNAYAKAHAGDKTVETVTDALIGAVAGAGVGAAGGAIAGGGKGAGKGAGIGGVVGAAAGTLYGLNEARSHEAQYVDAYRMCMKGRGYTG
jgi:hypothetical protein